MTTMTIRVRSLGLLPSVPAAQLRVGDIVVWPGGSVTVVQRIEEAGPFTLWVFHQDKNHGDHKRMHRKVGRLAVVRDGRWLGDGSEAPASYVCPHCQRRSFHPEDVRERYCAACHRFGGPP